MKLKQFKDYRWKDTEFLQSLAEKRLRETMEKQGKDIQEITMAIEEQKAIMPEKTFEEVVFAPTDNADGFSQIGYAESTETADELGLTDEDITYLKLRWGKAYKPAE